MRATSQLIAFTPARDLRRAKSLYEGVLGLRFAEQDDFAIVLDADGTMVRVAKVPEFEPAPYTFWDGKSPLSKAQSRRSRNAASIANGTSYGARLRTAFGLLPARQTSPGSKTRMGTFDLSHCFPALQRARKFVKDLVLGLSVVG